jgi:DNA-binding winged helix-turn-helix (wHTH) protein/Tfp pilus assembly protein PilF
MKSKSEETPVSYQFGKFRADSDERRLWSGKATVPLTLKAFETLLVLLENNGRVVTKEVLLESIWSDSLVEENCLAKNISTLRRALRENSSDPATDYIETVPRRGYRFVGNVKVVKKPHAGVASSLAVLPFLTINPRDGYEFLNIGLADVLVTELCNLRQILVRPTSAVRKYCAAERNPFEIGRELRVDWVLDGSMQHDGDRVRVTVRLLRVTDKRLMWGEKFDVSVHNLLAMQDWLSVQIAKKIAGELIDFSEAKPQLLHKRPTDTRAAFRFYLEGRFYWNKRTPEAMQKAAECFEQAVAQDPQYALAYAGLGDAYLLFSQHALLEPHLAISKAKAAAKQAVTLKPDLADAYATLGYAAFRYDWNWTEAERNFRLALDLNPNYATAHQWYGLYLRAMRRFDEAEAQLQRALEIDPLSLIITLNLGTTNLYQRRFDKAEEFYRKVMALDADFAPVYVYLGCVYMWRRQHERAIAALEKAVRLSNRDFSILGTLALVYAAAGFGEKARQIITELTAATTAHISMYNIALIYAKLKEFDRAFDFLQKACEARDANLTFLNIDQDLDDLRDDPRFEQIRQLVGLPL